MLLSARTPTSNVYATREPGWLPIVNLALQGRLPDGMLVVPRTRLSHRGAPPTGYPAPG